MKNKRNQNSYKLQAFTSKWSVFDVSHDIHYISSSDMTVEIDIPYHYALEPNIITEEGYVM